MEVLFLLVWKMRQGIEFHKSRAVLQALLSQKGSDDKTILKAFDELREAFFPFDRSQKKNDTQSMREVMMREISRGPLEIQVQADPGRKKVAKRLAQGNRELAQKARMESQGKSVAIDAFRRAQRRPRGAS